MASTFTEMLLSARRRAQLGGRPLTKNETAGIAAGQQQTASDRLAQAKALRLQEESGERTERMGQAALDAADARQQEQIEAQAQLNAENLAASEKQWTTQLGASEKQWTTQLEAQAGQFETDLTTRKQQFADQLAQAKLEAERRAAEFQQSLAEQKKTREEQMSAADRAMKPSFSIGKAATGAIGGAAAGAMVGAKVGAIGGPWGAAIGGILGALGGAFGGGCIIISACTDPNSYEVNIARQYRDRYMDIPSLRGYYSLAAVLVPLIHRSERVRRITKSLLVDRLVDYGEVCLGMKERTQRIGSRFVSKAFLSVCRTVGLIMPIPVEKTHMEN